MDAKQAGRLGWVCYFPPGRLPGLLRAERNSNSNSNSNSVLFIIIKFASLSFGKTCCRESVISRKTVFIRQQHGSLYVSIRFP